MKTKQDYEQAIADDSVTHVVGSDECGLGSLAGPLFVVAVLVPKSWKLGGVGDSKKLSAAVRQHLYQPIIKTVKFSVQRVDSDVIDRVGISSALQEAHYQAITGAVAQHTGTQPPVIVIDGIRQFHPNALCIPKADALIPAVSAASILGKVAHDQVMRELDKDYPGYGFGAHVGYGTSAHLKALKELGPCLIHRRTYEPIKSMVGKV